MTKKLTGFQTKFVAAYVSMDKPNAGAAYLLAKGKPVKITPVARQQGYRIMKLEHVKAEIDRLMAEVLEKAKINAQWVLDRLVEETTADLADIYDEDGGLRPIKEWPLVWRQGLVAGLDVDEIRVDGKLLGNSTKVKLSDRLKRLELIGKHVAVQAFKTDVDLEVKVPVTFVMNIG